MSKTGIKAGLVSLFIIILVFQLFLAGKANQNSVSPEESKPVSQNDETKQFYKDIYTPEYFAANAKSIPLAARILGESPDGELFILTGNDEPSVQPGLHRINPETGKVQLIAAASDPNLEIYDAVYGDKWLVWVESSPNLARDDWTIWAKNLNNGAVITVASNEVTFEQVKTCTITLLGPLLYNSPLSKGILVWSAFGKVNNQIVTYIEKCDLNTGQRERLDYNPNVYLGKYDCPSIDYPYIVYTWYVIQPEEANTFGNVMLFDLRTGEKRKIGDGVRSGSAKVYYPYVVWSQEKEIILYDIRTRKSRAVVKDCDEIWGPMLNDHAFTWMVSSPSLNIYLLPSGPQTVVVENTYSYGLIRDLIYWHPKSEEHITYYVQLPKPVEHS